MFVRVGGGADKLIKGKVIEEIGASISCPVQTESVCTSPVHDLQHGVNKKRLVGSALKG